MMNVPYVVLKYATLLLSFPINNVVEVVLTTLNPVLKSTNNPSHFLQKRVPGGIARLPDCLDCQIATGLHVPCCATEKKKEREQK